MEYEFDVQIFKVKCSKLPKLKTADSLHVHVIKWIGKKSICLLQVILLKLRFLYVEFRAIPLKNMFVKVRI